MNPLVRSACCSLAFAAAWAGACALAADPLIVTADLELDPTRTYGAIVIRTSNITLDGRGARIVPESTPDDPAKFTGTAILIEGAEDVTIRNLSAAGWERGLHAKHSRGLTVEDCDFSGNFHDPKFGWGENGRRGGILFEGVHSSNLRRCRANQVWDACALFDSNDNRLEHNDFSRTSNTCLKLWNASRNEVSDNKLSYGIRKDPGEVHARDSTSVLIESGSNDNRFLNNDCRYGGDGIFIRVLNQWVSTGNYFEGNDCSYANNNCVEAWSPENTWVRNKANHGSYGFWLGASDRNVLIDNEASYNGLPDGNHNSPHLPGEGHAGIVFMFGPSSHTVLRGNRCVGNNGAGIAAIGDLDSRGRKWNAFHWIIEQNALEQNRWGIYLQHAEMIDVAANRFADNRDGDVFNAGNVVALTERPQVEGIDLPPVGRLEGPTVVETDAEATFDASGSSDPQGRPLSFQWRTQPPGSAEGPTWTRTFAEPGFQRLALTVSNGGLSDLAWRDLYVVRPVQELGTDPGKWDWIDPHSEVRFHADDRTRLLGETSLRADVAPYSGGRIMLRWTTPDAPLALDGRQHLSVWLKTRNEHLPAWQDVNPLVVLTGSDGGELRLVPGEDLLSRLPYNEAREGWMFLTVPLAGNELWTAEGGIRDVRAIQLGFDSWGAPPLTIWIDGLALE
ncbi:MAG: right-handed parallel beta-helix repeat-containing protein [Planctomyces sp.]|nr:right-handed parallel beta-helix repeat-containing protein [Planctomyces sp.]